MTQKHPMLCEGETHLAHVCNLQFNRVSKHHRLTGIMCTISKGSRNLNTVCQMIMAGMSLVRLNFSHESHESHTKTLTIVREAARLCSEELGYTIHVTIALDTKGPEIRTGLIENNNDIELKRNDNIRLSTNKDLIDKGNREVIFIDYPNIIHIVKPGTKIFVNDGAIVLVVKEVAVDCLVCQIEVGGTLGSRKGVSIPGVDLDLPSVSEKDRFDIKFGVDNNVDVIFASKIRTASAIGDIRKVLGEKGKDIKIIAKLENLQGLQDVDNIINAADGILVARADLAVELVAEKVFLAQKAIIARANKVGKSVICGTQLMESMRFSNRPTRAEVADLGNAVLDGADCVLLSSESAIGNYPVETVKVVQEIITESETALWYRNLFNDLVDRNPAVIDAIHAVAIAAVDAARRSMATAIIVITTSGRSAELLSRYRPRCPIFAVTRCSRTARQVQVRRGIIPIYYKDGPLSDWQEDVDARTQFAMLHGKKRGIIKKGDTIIIVSPWSDGGGFTNNMRVLYAFFESPTVRCLIKEDKEKFNITTNF